MSMLKGKEIVLGVAGGIAAYKAAEFVRLLAKQEARVHLGMPSKAPVLFIPSMNVNMWENKALQKNIRILAERGYYFVEPGEGELACHWYGKGRLPELDEVVEKIKDLFTPKDLKGECILV